MIRVMHVISGLDQGGAEAMLVRLLRGLDQRARLPRPRAADFPRAVEGAVMSQSREAFLSRFQKPAMTFDRVEAPA